MTRGVRWYLVSSLVLVALAVLAGCTSHYLLAEREPWRHEAEAACLNSGAVNDTGGRVRISAIQGPGACGIDYPLRVSALGESSPAATPLSYDDEPVPPGAIPSGANNNNVMPRQWPGASPPVQSSALPPPQNGAPQNYPYPQSYPAPQPYSPPRSYATPAVAAPAGAPLSLDPLGAAPADDDALDAIPGGPPHPYYGEPDAPVYGPRPYEGGGPYREGRPYPQSLPPQAEPPPAASAPLPPLGPDAPTVTAANEPVQVQPPATLACPIVSVLDRWISTAVQPAALKWFHQPVVEIKQISAYSCRGMNGNPNSHISEHAFGNALDIAEFDLADGHKISLQYGWHGTPEEQGFLHDVQGAACQDFTTVLAPGANVYHYNHMHVDLMRRAYRPVICEPSAIPGEVAAARARSQFAARHNGEPRFTGSIAGHKPPRDDGVEDDDNRPDAVPGDD
jgi:hypothetical protein